jgi:hypothetical protein
MRQKASKVGNIVAKTVPVSMTEVSLFQVYGDLFNRDRLGP